MQATFNVLERSLVIDSSQEKPFGDTLAAVLNRHGQAVSLTGVSFGFALSLNGNETASQSWPPDGVKFRKTDQDVLATYRLRWAPGDEVSVSVWLVDAAGERHEAHSSFVAPVPPEPDPDAPLPPSE